MSRLGDLLERHDVIAFLAGFDGRAARFSEAAAHAGLALSPKDGELLRHWHEVFGLEQHPASTKPPAPPRRVVESSPPKDKTMTKLDIRNIRAELDRKSAALDGMLDPYHRSGPAYRSLREAYADVTGRSPYDEGTEDFARAIMRESVGFDSGRSTESVVASTWNLILGDSITRRMIADYNQPNLQTWRSVVSSIVPVKDFRQQKIERMGGYGVLPGVSQGAPYQPLVTPGNEEATYSLTKRGGTEDLTLEAIAADDLRLVQRIPQRLGLAAAQTLYRFVFDLLITNATYTPDSTSIFAAGHNNTAATALSNSNLNAARKAMRKQAAYGDTYDILSIVPKYIVTVPDLEHLAWQLSTSAVALPTSAPDGGAANQPNLHQGMQPVIVDYWSTTSTTAWFLVGDPTMTPTIEVGFFGGNQDPDLLIQSDPTVGSVFGADKITFRVRHVYSGAALDFRGLYRGNS